MRENILMLYLADPGKATGCSTNSIVMREKKSVSHSLCSTALWRRQAQPVRNGASGHKIDYLIQVQVILNLQGY